MITYLSTKSILAVLKMLTLRRHNEFFCELEADTFVRRFPSFRVATLRFYAVVLFRRVSPASLHSLKGVPKDLWGWVSNHAVARSCVHALTASTDTFKERAHEEFFIVAPTICQQRSTQDLLEETIPRV